MTDIRKPYRPKTLVIGWIIAVPLVVLLIVFLATNERFRWQVVGQYLTAPAILSGVWLTIWLTFVSMLIGVVLGVILAVMVRSKSGLLSWLASGYIWFFRGTPLLVQLVFWYNLSALLPSLSVGSTQIDINAIITPMTAAILGLGLNEAAYMAEIVRAGLLSVDNGQKEAAEALGLRPVQVLRKVILPQAMRAIIPPTGNQVVGMLKNTSLVSVLGAADLLHSAQVIYSMNFQTIPLLIVASLWYLVLTTVLSVGQHYLERYFGRSLTNRNFKRKAPAAGTEQIMTVPIQTVDLKDQEDAK
ncbi:MULTISPECIES: amino acid ABC transporter permease [unclassified Pseudoclavibacter]|uniref:amino acid ABC transporter permease n=1 Tax=unclassified Pseudoclavibacter TaxID=2615177 RepID=UPI0013018E61|nr:MULTISPECIES: amino acid ABC transporter permease [unclassified Pseudoclavibacter]KAB1644590.1 amino acid ABC transporter permease [Pseudoclavibacter sp. CFCC 14310]KAB1663904.1 amino acid ABC transporter permease [Pseudoclavibacter sp. CFCC 13611]